ncbi:trypsin-like serine protease [Ramicandelaber brevisporus]|nr:trypsin-like serine protease [Ramicandelaber brevisporus]
MRLQSTVGYLPVFAAAVAGVVSASAPASPDASGSNLFNVHRAITPRIANGTPANQKDFSFAAYIDIKPTSDGKQGARKCTGAVIGNVWVLTSSQCLGTIPGKESEYNKVKIYAGDAALDGGGSAPRGLLAAYFLPYNATTHENDIVILQADNDFDSTKVKPIKITQTPIYQNANATLAGFGATKKGGDMAKILNAGPLVIEGEETCSQFAQSKSIPYTNRNSGGFICSKSPKGSVSGCDNDDGSLLLFKEDSGYTLGGLFTQRLKRDPSAECGDTDTWEIFTNTKYYLNSIGEATKLGKDAIKAPSGSPLGTNSDAGSDAKPTNNSGFNKGEGGGGGGPNIGLIVGVSVGGVVLLAVIGGLIYYQRRSTKKLKDEVAIKEAENQYTAAALTEATVAAYNANNALQMQYMYGAQPVIAPADIMGTNATSGGAISAATAVDPTTGQVYAAQLDPVTGQYYAVSSAAVTVPGTMPTALSFYDPNSGTSQYGRPSADGGDPSVYDSPSVIPFAGEPNAYNYAWPSTFTTTGAVPPVTAVTQAAAVTTAIASPQTAPIAVPAPAATSRTALAPVTTAAAAAAAATWDDDDNHSEPPSPTWNNNSKPAGR